MNIPTILNPEANPASPKDLADIFTELADAALVSQARALVVERQIDLSDLSDPTGASDAAATLQREMRRRAGFLLGRGLRQVSAALAGGDAAANLVKALKTRLDAGADPELVLPAASRELDRRYLDARDLAAEASRLHEGAAAEADRFAVALDRSVAALDGEDGAIARAAADIAAVEQALERDLQEVVSNANRIGDGAKDLVTFALTTITRGAGAAKSGKKPSEAEGAADRKAAPGSGGGAAKTAGDGGAPKKDEPGFKVDKFPIEAVGVVAQGSEGVEAATAAFKSHNAELAGLYQRMAELNALLTAASALGGQAQGLVAGLAALAKAADALASSWGRLIGDLERFGAAIARTEPYSPERAERLALVGTASIHWSRLRQRLELLEKSLAGVGDCPPRADPPAAPVVSAAA